MNSYIAIDKAQMSAYIIDVSRNSKVDFVTHHVTDASIGLPKASSIRPTLSPISFVSVTVALARPYRAADRG